MERCAGGSVAPRIDARHQQVRPTVELVHCKEERSTRNPIAAIVRHLGSMPELRFWRNALRFSALRWRFRLANLKRLRVRRVRGPVVNPSKVVSHEELAKIGDARLNLNSDLPPPEDTAAKRYLSRNSYL